MSNRIGVRVTCVVCGDMKKPRGRSEPLGASYCTEDCSGYLQPFEFDEVCMRCGRLKCMTELILRCPCWKMRLPKRKEK